MRMSSHDIRGRRGLSRNADIRRKKTRAFFIHEKASTRTVQQAGLAMVSWKACTTFSGIITLHLLPAIRQDGTGTFKSALASAMIAMVYALLQIAYCP